MSDPILRDAPPAAAGAPDVVAAFTAWATREPDRAAVVLGDTTLTYGELDAAADRVARRLRSDGVGREHVVGVMLDRTPRLLTALLGVLKAGAAYLPLDPRYPRARLEFMLADSGASVVLTEAAVTGARELTGRTVFLDEQPDEPRLPDGPAGAASGGPSASPVVGAQAAYVIYTSGSTGVPKGVAVPRAAMSELLLRVGEALGAERLEAVLASTSASFDVSVFELFAPLTVGGRVVLVEDAMELCDRPVPGALLSTVPTVLAQMVALGALDRSTRTVLSAGEALPEAVLRGLWELGVEEVFNLYGPTEATVFVISTLLADEPGTPPIGRPLGSTAAYVLDERLRPVPPGTEGDLYIGGAQVARGYHGRPAPTAERFLPDPFSAEPGARMYRTGDIARLRVHDGALEYRGRADHQVKLRGHRIELGEVEAALAGRPEVVHVAVTVREDMRGGPRMVAYLVTAGGSEPAAEELRKHLRSTLPAHMVPNMFVRLEDMPRTPAGKIDRNALPKPVRAGARVKMSS